MLDSFTGCPVSEDIILYAIPVCAPYTAVTNYKCVVKFYVEEETFVDVLYYYYTNCRHRVKLVPGTDKRGKGVYIICVCVCVCSFFNCFNPVAARAALHRFIQSRESSQREKDLLKSVKVK